MMQLHLNLILLIISTQKKKLNYSNNNLQKHVMSASTKRKLESLGIDPTLVCDESQAKSLIQTRETEKSFKHYEKIVDRKEAIFRAVELAEKDDIVVILGKGHEDYQILKDKTIHFDDKEVARAAVATKFA